MHYDFKHEDGIAFILNQQDKYRIIKKIFYARYCDAMQQKIYDPSYDFIVSRVIENINLFGDLLAVNYKSKMLFCKNKQYLRDYIDFFNFLKKFYSLKAICQIIKSSILQNTLLEDSVIMYIKLKRSKDFIFEKQRGDINSIHNYFVVTLNALSTKNIKVVTINYSHQFIKMQSSFKDLTFVLPKTNKELLLWGTILKNCIYSYFEKISSETVVIFGVFKFGTLYYCVEVCEKNIIQASGARNQPVNEPDLSNILEWLQSQNTIDS